MSLSTKRDFQILLEAVGLALNFMYRESPELAGVYLDRLVDGAFLSPEQALQLMDVLREKYPPALPEGTE